MEEWEVYFLLGLTFRLEFGIDEFTWSFRITAAHSMAQTCSVFMTCLSTLLSTNYPVPIANQ
jgi:hypothetical protein